MTTLHVRIDDQLKEDAVKALDSMGLTLSDAVRMLMKRIVADQAIPFDIHVPNAETIASFKELDSGGGKSFSSVEDLMTDLDA